MPKNYTFKISYGVMLKFICAKKMYIKKFSKMQKMILMFFNLYDLQYILTLQFCMIEISL